MIFFLLKIYWTYHMPARLYFILHLCTTWLRFYGLSANVSDKGLFYGLLMHQPPDINGQAHSLFSYFTFLPPSLLFFPFFLLQNETWLMKYLGENGSLSTCWNHFYDAFIFGGVNDAAVCVDISMLDWGLAALPGSKMKEERGKNRQLDPQSCNDLRCSLELIYNCIFKNCVRL